MTIPDAPNAIQEAAATATLRATAGIAGSTLWRTIEGALEPSIGAVVEAIEASAVQAMGDEP